MSDPVQVAEAEVAAAHEELRAAIRRADAANHRRTAAYRRADGEEEGAVYSEGRAAFVEKALLVDYVTSGWWVDLNEDGRDYHTVSTTDGRASAHRVVGLAVLAVKFLGG